MTSHSFALDSEGDVIVVGEAIGTNEGNGFVSKLDFATGAEIWTHEFDTSITDFVQTGFVGTSDEIFVAGTVTTTLPDTGMVTRLSSAGNVQWSSTFKADSAIATVNSLRCVKLAASGSGVVVACYGADSSDGRIVTVLAKYTGGGDEVFVSTDYL